MILMKRSVRKILRCKSKKGAIFMRNSQYSNMCRIERSREQTSTPVGKDGNLGSLDFGELNVFISSEKGHKGGDVLYLSKRCCSKKKLMSYPSANSIIEAKLPFHQKAGAGQQNFITCMIIIIIIN